MKRAIIIILSTIVMLLFMVLSNPPPPGFNSWKEYLGMTNTKNKERDLAGSIKDYPHMTRKLVKETENVVESHEHEITNELEFLANKAMDLLPNEEKKAIT